MGIGHTQSASGRVTIVVEGVALGDLGIDAADGRFTLTDARGVLDSWTLDGM